MGSHNNITHVKFPKQSKHVDKPVNVCFHYDLDHILHGTFVRDDMEEPWETIILLEDGRYVRGVECQYQPEFGPVS